MVESHYSSKVASFLEKHGLKVGDYVEIKINSTTLKGIIMPSTIFSGEDILILKLDNGYNTGVSVSRIKAVRKLKRVSLFEEHRLERLSISENLPRISLIGAGGTIASRVDYETGAVRPAIKPEDLYEIIPELSTMAIIESREVLNILSENMHPKYYTKLVKAIYDEVTREDVKGVIVTHGTDTMAYTAAAVAFSIQGLPKPVILVGSQRSSDRPSSDAFLNLICAVYAASTVPIAEAMVLMHGSINDDYCLLHRGVRVRKCHTSRRDAFKSINDIPLAKVWADKYEILNPNYIERDESRTPKFKPKFNDKVALLKAYPGFPGSIIEHLIDQGFEGIVLEGTGLGHFPEYTLESLKKAVREGLLVAMTSQCLWGRVNMNVYSTGRNLVKIGVIPLEDMLPEVALIKMMWVTANYESLEERKQMLQTNLVGELSLRSLLGGFNLETRL